MVGSSVASTGKTGQVDLNTLVAAIQNSVQAQNLIATRLASVITALTAQTAAIVAQTAAITTAFPPPLTSSATWDPPSLVSGASELQTIAVAGAALGQFAQAAFSLDLQGMSLTGYVSAANTVTVVLSNLTGGTLDLGSGTLKVSVK